MLGLVPGMKIIKLRPLGGEALCGLSTEGLLFPLEEGHTLQAQVKVTLQSYSKGQGN